MGRPLPGPGEPLFTEDDTAGVLALAEEERDTCPQCGFLKVWCRDPAHQFAFDVEQATCWPTWRLAQFHESDAWKGKHETTKLATQLSLRFREGIAPDIEAGLGLAGQQENGSDE